MTAEAAWLWPLAAAAVGAASIGLADYCNRRLRGWLPDDLPRGGRKQHGRPIPLAGIALLPAAVGLLWHAAAYWLLLAAVLAAGIGYLDDRSKEGKHELPWQHKALALLLACGLLAAEQHHPLQEPGQFALALGLAFVLVNATNFLDNTDGVAAALSATSLLWLSGGSGPLAALGGLALGFLPWNWPRARVFLGDAGAYLFGIALAWGCLPALQGDPGLLWACALQLGDFSQVVLARLWLGHPPWVGDRRHLTHILHHLGLHRVLVAPVLAAAALLLLATCRR